jgi:hypothetical protein
LSWEAEDLVIKQAEMLFKNLGAHIEIRNQARVHLWYPENFGIAYPTLKGSTEAINRFLTIKSDNFLVALYLKRAESWKSKWPELTIISV